MKGKINRYFLASCITAALHLIVCAVFLHSVLTSPSGPVTQVSNAISALLISPHIIFVALATFFNLLALLLNSKGLAITSIVLYAISLVFASYYYILFVIFEIVFLFIGCTEIQKVECVICGRKKTMFEEFYHNLCQSCAKDTRKQIKSLLADLNDFVSSSKAENFTATEATLQEYRSKIRDLEDLKEIYPSFKKDLSAYNHAIDSINLSK